MATFAGTLVNVGDLRRNSGECERCSDGYGDTGSPTSPKLAKPRQTSHE